MAELWRLIKDPPLPGKTNMDRDLEILHQVSAGDAPPTLRLYRWEPPAVSLGHFQQAEKVVDGAACNRLGIDIVRRPTGGRALLHYREVTYSLAIPESHPFIPAGIVKSYRFISRALVRALEMLGADTQVARDSGRSNRLTPGSCFDTASAYELQVNRKKVVGSAQLRRHGVLLQHGSVLLELDPELNREVFLSSEDKASPVKTLQNRAAGLWDLGLQIGEEELIYALQEGFAHIFGTEFKEPGPPSSLTTRRY